MNHEVLRHYNCLTVGEGFGVRAEAANLYVGKDRRELQMIYHFDHAVPREEARFLAPAPEFSLVQLRDIFNRWNNALGNDGWQNIYFGNHDNPRVLSRFGNVESYRYESATMLATVLLTQRGTPSVYQGDELGMCNEVFEKIEQLTDVQVKNAYQNLEVAQKGLSEQFLAACNRIARDHARTPIAWQNAPNGIYDYYRQLIQLRKNNGALMHGNCTDLNPTDNAIWAYTRQFDNDKCLIICNFTDKNQLFDLPADSNIEKSIWLMGNYAPVGIRQKMQLKPYETLVYRLF